MRKLFAALAAVAIPALLWAEQKIVVPGVTVRDGSGANSTRARVIVVPDGTLSVSGGTATLTISASGASGSTKFYLDNQNAVSATSFTVPSSQFTRLTVGTSVEYRLNPASVTLLGPGIGVAEIEATGTADNTTFLRGDGSWATPAGGGGGGGASGDAISSSTMSRVIGATGGAEQTAISFQTGSPVSTAGYITTNRFLFWGSSMQAVGPFVSTSGFHGPGNDLVFSGAKWVFPTNVTVGRPFIVTAAASGSRTFMTIAGTAMDMGASAMINSTGVWINPGGRLYTHWGIFGTHPGAGEDRSAAVKITSGTGTNGVLLQVSTGTTNLFEVTGASVSVKVPLYDSAGNLFATSVSGDNMGNMTATNRLNMGGFAIDNVSSMSMVGPSGAALTIGTTEGLIILQTDSPSTTKLEVGRSSVNVPSGIQLIADTTAQYIGWLNQVSFSSMVITTPSTNGYSMPVVQQLDSTGTWETWMIIIASASLRYNPWLYLVTTSTGNHPDDFFEGVAIGTPSVNGSGQDDVVWFSSTVVNLSSQSAGVAGRTKHSRLIPIPNAGALAGRPNVVILIKRWNLPQGGGSGQRIHRPPVLYWSRRPLIQ